MGEEIVMELVLCRGVHHFLDFDLLFHRKTSGHELSSTLKKKSLFLTVIILMTPN